MLALAASLAAVAPSSAQAALTTTPSADTYVREDRPATAYGTSKTLRPDGSPRARAYLKFQVAGTGGAVTSAKLRVYANSTTSAGLEAARVADTGWTEAMTWAKAPAVGAKLGASGAITKAGWVELDVTSAVTGDGTVAFAVTTPGAAAISVASREGANRPVLVVDSGPVPPPVDTTAPGAPAGLTAQSGDASVSLNWNDSSEADLAGYRVYRQNADGSWPSAPTASVTSSAWTDGGRVNGTAYSYRVTAYDAAGNQSAASTTASATPKAPDTQPAFPIRAAFYYPWFPEAWDQAGMSPYTKYHPTLGFYDGAAPAVIESHVRSMVHGGFDAAIASWWGQGSREDAKFPALLSATRNTGLPLRWAAYYEQESLGDPSAAQISSDLAYIAGKYGNDPAFLRVNGRPVIFVYADGADACAMADRWKQGNTVNAYVVLKVFAGYKTCASQPDSWHQYSPAAASDQQAGYSYSISPGFYKADEALPRLTRDLTRFRQNIRAMIASGSPWQLVTSFNEWGEGTSVESATEWSSAGGQGGYLDALHDDGADPATAPAPTPTATPTATATATATPPPGSAVTALAAGDIQPSGTTSSPTEPILDTTPHAALITLGDNQYQSGTLADYNAFWSQTWGEQVDKAKTYPAPGNHEHQSGLAANYCTYFRGGVNGPAAVDPCALAQDRPYYSYNLGDWHLVSLDSGSTSGNDADLTISQRSFLSSDLQADKHLCQAVYMHHPRYSAGSHGSNANLADDWQLMMDLGVDLVMGGHDHNYQRWTRMGAQNTPDAAKGIRQFVVGTGGGGHYSTTNRPAGLESFNDTSFGVLKLNLRSDAYDWTFLPEAGRTFTDSGTETCR